MNYVHQNLIEGRLRKLVGVLSTETGLASYSLPLGTHLIPLNERLGQTLTLEFTGQIHCVACEKSIKKSYNQGYCYPCTLKLAQCDMCILKPERCHFDKGTCREPEWGETHCMIPHVVYLANSSDIKVGITRKTQIPTRWLDQGANFALPMFEVPTRYASGLLEIEIAKHISDKTNWRNMLKNDIKDIDLKAQKIRLFEEIQPELNRLMAIFPSIRYLEDAPITQINFPVLEYPQKIVSLNFDTQHKISGRLMGIKGQYLIFDTGVINMRKFGGYVLRLLD